LYLNRKEPNLQIRKAVWGFVDTSHLSGHLKFRYLFLSYEKVVLQFKQMVTQVEKKKNSLRNQVSCHEPPADLLF